MYNIVQMYYPFLKYKLCLLTFIRQIFTKKKKLKSLIHNSPISYYNFGHFHILTFYIIQELCKKNYT